MFDDLQDTLLNTTLLLWELSLWTTVSILFHKINVESPIKTTGYFYQDERISKFGMTG